MKDKELDDLFRRNADYLADEPPRDFDKDAFWQQLQTELPKKSNQPKKIAAWWWAAASVFLAGTLGSIWWMQSVELGGEEVAVKAGAIPPPQSEPWSVSPQTRSDSAGLWGLRPRNRALSTSVTHDSTKVGPLRGLKPGKMLLAKKEELVPHPTPSNYEGIAAEPKKVVVENLYQLENEPILPEVIAPAIPEKPAYRVVHINEIRQRKQQEAKARSRTAFRIGLPSGPRTTTPSNNKPLLTIPIQH